ncbi:MAG: hypothetical protein NTY76_01870 [Candidatus Omnitrophica bacterium]|nr:hypothetical protein [Candidatus Omnitrophota bacterium]
MITIGSNGSLKKKKPFKALICIVTLAAFLFNTVSYDAAWAVGTPSELSDNGSNKAGGQGFTKDINVTNFTLPKDLGSVTNSYAAANPDKVVIHIQDAHCNYAAQHQISKIIEYVNKEYGVVSVNLEGGAKGYDLSAFSGISDKSIKNKVADYFVKEGLVNGAEYFAINNPGKTNLWGVEDVKLYIDGLAVYRNSLVHKEEIDKYLKSLNHIISNLKAKIYSTELLDFDMKYGANKSNNMEFKEYLSYLLGAAKANGIDTKRLANIYLLDQVFAKEANIDFKKANKERDDLIDGLQKKLSKNAVEELIAKTVEFKQERIAQKSFYTYLTARAEKAGVDMAAFPELQKYIAYISIYGAMDEAKVMEEKEALEDTIKGVLCRNDKEKELSRLSKNLALLKNIFDISLAKDDYRYYLVNKDSFNVSRYAAFIDKEALLYKITALLDKDASSLDRYREDISQFYEYSIKRDEAFLKNMKYSANGYSKSIAILVTGGFHNENLAEMFRKEGIAYVSITPNFKNADGYECPYFKILSGKESDLVASLDEALGTMQIASPFNELGKLVDPEGAELDRILPAMIAYYDQNGAFAILTTAGNYLIIDKIDNKYHFSRPDTANGKKIVNEGMPIDTHKTEEILRMLSRVGVAVSKEEAPQAPTAAPTHEMIAENSVYVALCLLFTTVINAAAAKEDKHFDLLARSFGISETQARDAVNVLNSMEHTEILKAVVRDIVYNMRSPQANQPEFFFQNVLLPYIAIVSRGFLLSDQLEEELSVKFCEVFGTGRYNPLAEFVRSFRKSLQGSPLEVKYFNNLNAVLKTRGFRVEVMKDYSTGYKIAAKVTVDSGEVGSVLILSRFGVALLNNTKGASFINEKDVTITLDHINNDTKNIEKTLREGRAPISYLPTINGIFNKAGIWIKTAEGSRVLLTTSKANSILGDLYQKQFRGMVNKEIMAGIAHNIAIHEAKHQWEEVNPNMSKLSIDREISAYLAEAIYGALPVEGLIALIGELEFRYLNIEDISVKNAMRLLLQEIWDLAYRFDQGVIDEGGLRKELINIYNGYECVETRLPLPVLTGFETEVLPKLSLQKVGESLDVALGTISPTTPSQAVAITAIGEASQTQPSVLTDIIPLLEAQKIDRIALVNEMKQKASAPEAIQAILMDLEKLKETGKIDEYQMGELEMALRTAMLVKGLSDIEKNGHLNIVVQIAGIGESSKARRPLQDIKNKLENYPYNLYARSILEEGVDSEDGLKALIDRIIVSLKDPANKNPRALLLLPEDLYEGCFADAENYLKTKEIYIDRLDAPIKIQRIKQEGSPDFITQFGLGFEILEYVRKGEGAEPSQGLLNLIAAMVEGAADPRAVLNELFKGILKIRKIDWKNVTDQRKAWEAVATAL